MKSIRIIRTDDWSGLYIDGKLAYEGHSVEVDHLPLDEPIRIVTNVYVENQWTEDMAYNGDPFPMNWCDIPAEAFA
jgi:hypothetical protein